MFLYRRTNEALGSDCGENAKKRSDTEFCLTAFDTCAR